MKNKLKNNTKIKLISLLSAIVLWIYVMAIVDPEDSRLFENVPVVVTNIEELAENDLIVYPESDLVADINIKGKLSDVQKITVDDIHIYGTINNPMEGNNKLSLKVNITKQVSYEFKTDFIVVRLEKLLYDEKDIKPEIIGKYKDDVDTVSLSQDTVEISGPRILIDQVDHVKASIKVDDNSKNMLNQKVKLMAVNNVGVEIKLLEEKEVPINIQLKDNTVDISKYEIKPSMVTIRGKKDVLDNIDYINTKKLDIASIGPLTKVELEVPEGIAIKDNNISIKLKESESSQQRLIYDSNDVELKNNYDKIDASKLNIPDNINVEVELNDGESKIDKSDIKLYIDLSEGYEEGKKYNIKYATDKNVKSIIIIPSEVG